MMALFDEEFIYRTAMKHRLRDAEEQGMQRGMEKGMQQGMQQGVVSSIKNLMQNMTMTFEQASAALGIPTEDRPKYAEMME